MLEFRLRVTLCSVLSSLICRPRDPKFGVEWTRVTAFLFKSAKGVEGVGLRRSMVKNSHDISKAFQMLQSHIDLWLTQHRSAY